jgi:hypothetical protein
MRQFLAKNRTQAGGRNDALFLRLATFFELTPESYASATGCWVRRDERWKPAGWLGGMLPKLVKTDEGTPTRCDGVEYGADEIAYFLAKIDRKVDRLPATARKLVAACRPGAPLSQVVRELVCRDSVFTLTGRLRARASYRTSRNTVFQGLAADGANRAL